MIPIAIIAVSIISFFLGYKLKKYRENQKELQAMSDGFDAGYALAEAIYQSRGYRLPK